jgi:hypothetical protein
MWYRIEYDCLIHTNRITRKTYMESAWMLHTLCIILFLRVCTTHIRPGRQGSRRNSGNEHVEPMQGAPTGTTTAPEPIEQTEPAEPAGRARAPRPKRVATPDAFV